MSGATITLPPVTLNCIAKMQAWPSAIMRAIAEGQEIGTQKAVGDIITRRLTGKGPFPPSEHRLGRVTHDLAMTTTAVPATIDGNRVRTAVGGEVPYWFLHEFGFYGRQAARTHSRSSSGRDVFARGPRGGKKGKLSSGLAIIASHTRLMNMPARAPVQTGIAENYGTITSAIGDAVSLAWRTA